jgi:hypothetical protein
MSEAVNGGAPIAQTGSTGGAGGSGGVAAQAAAATQAAAVPGAGATSADWTAGLSENLRGYVQNKQFKDPAAVLDSYINLEKLIGVPKDRLLKLPEKPDAPEWKDVYSRLGKPPTAAEYKIQATNGNEDFAKWAQETFHGLNLTKEQGEKLAAKWDEYGTNALKAKELASLQAVEEENNSLKKEWGMAFDKNINTAKAAVREFGLESETIDKLQDALGYAGVMKFLNQVGAKLGESEYVSGGNSSKDFGVMTPEAAKNRIQTLRGDKDFVTRYVNNEFKAKEEMARLHKMAYGE